MKRNPESEEEGAERPRTLLLVVGGPLPGVGRLERLDNLLNAGVYAPVEASGDPVAHILAGAADGVPRLWDALDRAGVRFVAVGVPGRLQGGNGTFHNVPSEGAGWEKLQQALGEDWGVCVAFLPDARAEDVERRLPDLLEASRQGAPDALALAFLGHNGGFLIAGPGVRSVDTPLANVNLMDLTPTLLTLLHVDRPEGMEGYPLDEALEEEADWTEEDEASVKEHLAELGYLE